jgi:hypothetical protein
MRQLPLTFCMCTRMYCTSKYFYAFHIIILNYLKGLTLFITVYFGIMTK